MQSKKCEALAKKSTLLVHSFKNLPLWMAVAENLEFLELHAHGHF